MQFSDDHKTVRIGNTTISVEIVATEAARQQGLSGRESLPKGSGMLFEFETEGNWGIWMKDMRFSIDIVWIDSGGKVVSVAADVSPNTYPHVFYPNASALYVLELPGGFAASSGIEEGDRLDF